MREAKSIEVIEQILLHRGKVRAYDPAAMENAKRIFGNRIHYSRNAYDAARGTDALVVLTEWREFKLLNLEKICHSMKQPYIFDGRNLYNFEKNRRLGFHYYGIGRSVNSHH